MPLRNDISRLSKSCKGASLKIDVREVIEEDASEPATVEPALCPETEDDEEREDAMDSDLLCFSFPLLVLVLVLLLPPLLLFICHCLGCSTFKGKVRIMTRNIFATAARPRTIWSSSIVREIRRGRICLILPKYLAIAEVSTPLLTQNSSTICRPLGVNCQILRSRKERVWVSTAHSIKRAHRNCWQSALAMSRAMLNVVVVLVVTIFCGSLGSGTRTDCV